MTICHTVVRCNRYTCNGHIIPIVYIHTHTHTFSLPPSFPHSLTHFHFPPTHKYSKSVGARLQPNIHSFCLLLAPPLPSPISTILVCGVSLNTIIINIIIIVNIHHFYLFHVRPFLVTYTLFFSFVLIALHRLCLYV